MKNTDTITWQIDQAHSKIEFSVSHMVISHVTGYFKKFDCTVKTQGESFENAAVELTMDVASIDTNNEQRDKHLTSPDFIDVSKHPKITFKSTSMAKVHEKSYKLIGDFSMNGVTKPIELNVKYNGTVKDTYNNFRAGFKITGEINRKDYNINWHAKLDSGGLIAGDEVEINCLVEIIHQ